MNLIKRLNLKEVINVLSEYNLEHCRFPHNYLAETSDEIPEIMGMTLGDRRLILIDKEQNCEESRETVIHELIHCKHYQLGDLKGSKIEGHVERETKLTYNLLYKK